nr:hypothetical protein [Methanobrevibacter arboriphilus]
MKTVITLENVPFEGMSYANFIGSLGKLYKDFGIPRENVNYSNDLTGRQYSVDKEHVWDSLTDLVNDLGKLGFRNGLRFKKGIYYRDNDKKEWKELF